MTATVCRSIVGAPAECARPGLEVGRPDTAAAFVSPRDAMPSLAAAPRQPTLVAFVAHARAVPSAAREAAAARLEALPPAAGLVVIHTCQRVEAYVSTASLDETLVPDLGPGVVRLTDADAARHLVTVACGLDSAVLGEDQILHQLREAHAARHASGPLDPVLDRLFAAALHAGRAAHSWFGGGSRSLADLAVDRIAAAAGSLDGKCVLVVGVGTMGRLAALAAAGRGARVLVTNRTAWRAKELAREVGGEAIPFDADRVVPAVAGVVVAIRGEWAIGPDDAAALASSQALVVDLSTPPAVPSAVRVALGDRFLSIDDIAGDPGIDAPTRLRGRLETLIADTGREYCRWLRSRASVPAIQALAAAAETQRAEEMEWLRRRLPDMSDEERLAIEQMTHRLVAGILHRPLSVLNDDATGRLEQAARDLFRI